MRQQRNGQMFICKKDISPGTGGLNSDQVFGLIRQRGIIMGMLEDDDEVLPGWSCV
jgi:hypothetical protein